MRRICALVVLAVIALLLFFAVESLLFGSKAKSMDREELRNVPPHIRQWFEGMKSPVNDKLCCSYADGHRTEYDMKQNQYWVPIRGEWHPVPPEVVITDKGNPFSEAVVWYNMVHQDGKIQLGKYKILCFVPGGGG